jgi:ribose transport system permease protein
MLKAAPSIQPRIFFKKFLSQYSYWLSFFLLLIIARIINPNFFRWTNISNIFVQSAPTGIIALGMTMVICAGQIDISVGAQVAIISGLSIMVLNATSSIWVTLLFCLGLGIFIGTFNGVLVAKGRMPAMIATLAVQTACRSIINQIGQGGPFTVADKANYDVFRMVAAGSIQITDGFKIPYPMIMFVLISLLFGLIMQRTKLGKHVYAVGSNETSARLAGVSVDKVKILVFSITGLLCGFSGWLYASRVMAVAAASAGNLFEMDAIAAVAIGGTAMSGGRGKIIGTFLGVLMFKIINNILTMANVPTFLNGAISGGIIIIAVLLQNTQGRRK